MWDQLEKLLVLQELDHSIAALQAACREIPAQIQALEGETEQARASLQGIKAEVEAFLRLRRSKERELEECYQNLKKRQARLFEVKTNQEYTAVLKEIEVLKEKQSQLEEEILEILERCERLAVEEARAADELAHRELWFRREKTAREGELEEKKAELSGLLIKRKERAEGVEPSLLYTYNKLLKSRGGLAVVAVKDSSCLGCFVALTPQAYAEVQKNEKLITCANCNRILYFKG